MSFLPKWAVDVLLGLLIIALILFAGYLYGDYQYHLGVMSVHIMDAKAEGQATIRSSNVTATAIPKLTTQMQYIQGATVVVEKKVPVYVTVQNDKQCVVPNGFVSLWNDTNKMQLPADSATVPAGASSVVLSDIAAQHAREAGICHANESLVDSMQAWLRDQQAAYEKK